MNEKNTRGLRVLINKAAAVLVMILAVPVLFLESEDTTKGNSAHLRSPKVCDSLGATAMDVNIRLKSFVLDVLILLLDQIRVYNACRLLGNLREREDQLLRFDGVSAELDSIEVDYLRCCCQCIS